jgi:hypothetical protein
MNFGYGSLSSRMMTRNWSRLRPAPRRGLRLRSCAMLETRRRRAAPQRGGDVVRVHVRLHGAGKLERERVQRREIALPGRQHRVHEQRPPGLLAAQKVGVRARDRLEQLAKDHAELSSA